MELNRNCVVFNPKWVTDLNIKLKTIKFFIDNLGLRAPKRVLRHDIKSTTPKENNDQ